MRRKLNKVNVVAQSQVFGIQDHINFTLHKAYECFDRRRKQEEIRNCVEHYSVSVLTTQNFVESEMAKF